jgi:hypothetical protein
MLKRIAWALAVISLAVLSIMIPLAATQTMTGTTIQVAPSTLTEASGTTFTVNVTITNVTSLVEWEFGLYYDNTILTCTSVVEGPFLNQFDSTFFESTINNAYNATYGWVLAGSALSGAAPGVNGSGTLATITFQAQAAGYTTLHFSSDPEVTLLLNSSNPPFGEPIPFTAIDGAVNVTGTHDVGVSNVISYKTVIGQGYAGNITVTTENLGTFTETFNLTLYVNAAYIASQNVTVSSGNSVNVTLTWDTTGFAYGNYTISAYAWPVPGETNTANNNCTGGWVVVALVGDVTGPNGVPDGKVDIRDVHYIAMYYGTTMSSPNWNPNADINNDGKIDIRDVHIAAANYGKTDP